MKDFPIISPLASLHSFIGSFECNQTTTSHDTFACTKSDFFVFFNVLVCQSDPCLHGCANITKKKHYTLAHLKSCN